MASFENLRDPGDDHLLTPQNTAVVIIDFQPVQAIIDRLALEARS